jgi:hypothetical protein
MSVRAEELSVVIEQRYLGTTPVRANEQARQLYTKGVNLVAFRSVHFSDILDKVLGPEVRPEVHNLPRTKRHEHSHGANSKPLDTLVCALVGISQLNLTSP